MVGLEPIASREPQQRLAQAIGSNGNNLAHESFSRDIIWFVKIDTDSRGDGTEYGGGEGDGQWPARLAPVLDIARPAVGFVLSSTGYAVARRFRETLAPLELEPREFALLRAVGAAEGQTQQAIGERLGIPASRMVAFVDALEARALLERRANPIDRRARALHLTSAGSELLESRVRGRGRPRAASVRGAERRRARAAAGAAGARRAPARAGVGREPHARARSVRGRVAEKRLAAFKHTALRAEAATVGPFDSAMPIERDEHVVRARRTAACTRIAMGVIGVALLLTEPRLLVHPALGLAGFAAIASTAIVQLAAPHPRWLGVEESLSALAGVLIIGLGSQHVSALELLWLVAIASGVLARGGRAHWLGRNIVLGGARAADPQGGFCERRICRVLCGNAGPVADQRQADARAQPPAQAGATPGR